MRMHLTASRDVTVPHGQAARAHVTWLLEYKMAFKAHARTRSMPYGSVTSASAKISAQSELMGPSSAGFALWACLARPLPTDATIHVLIEL